MNEKMIVYLSGKITGKEDYKKDFAYAESFLLSRGHIVVNPARLDEVAEGLTYEDYLRICYTLVDIADAVFMLGGWQESKGATAELNYAKSLGKKIMYQNYYDPFRRGGENE